jgi:hypothetical protein
VKEYEIELMQLRKKPIWDIDIKQRHIDLFTRLSANGIVSLSIKKFAGALKEKWNDRRFSRLMTNTDILDDPHQVSSLLGSSIKVIA